jgi:hypothetical protein
MKPETRAKKDKCTLVASIDHGKLRVLGVGKNPSSFWRGRVSSCGRPDAVAGPRAAGLRRADARHPEDARRDAPAPPGPPHEVPKPLSRTAPGGLADDIQRDALFGRPTLRRAYAAPTTPAPPGHR